MALTLKISGTAGVQATLRRAAADLATLVRQRSAAFPAADHDWLTEPLRHAAATAASHLRAGDVTAAEAAVHEVQTWALLAMRHGHWSPRTADDVDRRCEAILDYLHATPAVVRRAA